MSNHNFEKYLPNLYGENKENIKEKSNNKIEKMDKDNSFKEKMKALGKKALPYIAAASTLIGIANNTNAQSEKKSQPKEYVVTGPDGKTYKFKSLDEEINYAKKMNWIITNQEDGTIYYPDGKIVKKDGREIKQDTIQKPEVKGNLIYHWPNATNTDSKQFKSLEELINAVRNTYHAIYDSSRVFVTDESGKRYSLKDVRNLKEKGDNKKENKEVKLVGRLTYFWPNYNGTQYKQFNSLEELKYTVENTYHAIFDPGRVLVKDETGQEAKLNEVIDQINKKGVIKQPEIVRDLDSLQQREAGEVDNKKDDIFENNLPEGKGDVIKLNKDGSASIYKVNKKGNKIKIKKKGRANIISPNNNSNIEN